MCFRYCSCFDETIKTNLNGKMREEKRQTTDQLCSKNGNPNILTYQLLLNVSS